jgi:hypothetical protein
MMEYDHKCKMDPKMPLKYPCTRSSIHLATLVIINLCPVMMSQSGDITPSPQRRNVTLSEILMHAQHVDSLRVWIRTIGPPLPVARDLLEILSQSGTTLQFGPSSEIPWPLGMDILLVIDGLETPWSFHFEATRGGVTRISSPIGGL